MWLSRTLIIGAAAIVALVATDTRPASANLECDTIRMIVPWKAGGGTDRLGRGLAAALERISGKSVIVDNISGASSATGTIKAMQANPDGCTWLMNGSTEINAFMTFNPNLPFDLDQMKFVGAFYTTPTWMVAHKDRGYETFQDFVEKAKANPGELTLGTGGASGAHMVMAAAIKGYADLDVRIVPYSGGADLKKAVIANQVDAGVIHSPVLLKEVEAGMVNVLTAGGPLDVIEYEPIRDTPSLESMDLPIRVSVHRGVFVPKDTPDAIAEEIAGLVKKAVTDEEFVEFGKKFGFPPTWMSGEQFEETMRQDAKSFQEIYNNYIKAGG